MVRRVLLISLLLFGTLEELEVYFLGDFFLQNLLVHVFERLFQMFLGDFSVSIFLGHFFGSGSQAVNEEINRLLQELLVLLSNPHVFGRVFLEHFVDEAVGHFACLFH